MADTSYRYDVIDDFLNDLVNGEALQKEIEDSAISSATILFVSVLWEDAPLREKCDIWFNSSLSPGDETLLDAVVAAHTGDPLPEIHPIDAVLEPVGLWLQDGVAAPTNPGEVRLVSGAVQVRDDTGVMDIRTHIALHKSAHEPGGGDALVVDAVAGTGSLRTLGTGAQQACSGSDSRLTDGRLLQNFQQVSSLGSSSTSGTSWVTKLTLVTGALTGEFRVGASWRFWNNGSIGRIRLYNVTTTTEIAEYYFKPTDAAVREAMGLFTFLTLSGTSNSIAIQFRADQPGDSQYINTARIEFWRVS